MTFDISSMQQSLVHNIREKRQGNCRGIQMQKCVVFYMTVCL